MDASETDQRIWQVVSLIPAGQVATYGDVAEQAGMPGAARRVGAALRKLPAGSKIPWHRVVNASGHLSLAPGSASYRRQWERLLAEDVPLRDNGAIDLRQCRMPGP